MYINILRRLRDAVRRSIKHLGVLLDSKLFFVPSRTLCMHSITQNVATCSYVDLFPFCAIDILLLLYFTLELN
jgi:hypothetical protein